MNLVPSDDAATRTAMAPDRTYSSMCRFLTVSLSSDKLRVNFPGGMRNQADLHNGESSAGAHAHIGTLFPVGRGIVVPA